MSESILYGKIIEPNAAYHASAPISKSRLSRIGKSPAWFKWCEDNPQPQTAAMTFGSAFHKFVLEPNDFDNDFAIAPNCDKRTAIGKQMYAEFVISSNGKTIIDAADFETIRGMQQSVLSNKYAAALIKGDVEQSYCWADLITGEACKCRPDVQKSIKDKHILIDLKSCAEADTDSFMRAVIDYSYDLQAYMYAEGLKQITGFDYDFVFIAVEKKPPYLLNILQADEFVLNRGESLFREYLGTYHECKLTGNWYGYNGFSGAINNLSLPEWMKKEFE